MNWDFDKSKDVAELLGKAAVGLLGICYVIGLIVTTIHLHQYGIFSLDLLRLSYVVAGVWTLIPLFLSSTVIFIFWKLFLRSLPRHQKPLSFARLQLRLLKKGKYGSFAKRLASSLALPLLFLISVRVSVSFASAPEPVSLPLPSMIYVFPISLCLVVLWESRHEIKGKPHGISLLLVVVPVLLAFFIFYLMSFGKFDYQTIPAYAGGGRPTPVKLLLDIDDTLAAELKASGIEFEKDAASLKLTYEVDLILATGNEYVVKGVVFAIGIPRNTVKAIFYKNAYIGWGK